MARSVFYFTDSRAFGGAEQALLILLEHLDRKAWTPTLLYHEGPGVAPLVSRAEELGVHLSPVLEMPLGLTGARRVPQLRRALRQAQPAVFHAHLSWPLAAKYGLAAAVLARVPAVVATVASFPAFSLDRSTYVQERLLARGVDRYIAVSHDVSRRLHEQLGWPRDKIDVIHNGVQIERFQRPAADGLRRQLAGGSDGPLLLAVARLDAQKGLDVLLDAVASLETARLVIAGEGPEHTRLESQAAALGIGDRILFLGHRQDIPELLAATDAFVLPSRVEGSSLAVLEAMGAGKAVVSSAIAGTDELIVHGESGLLVPPGDANALADAVGQLLSEPGLRERLGTAALSRVRRHFSASVVVAEVLRLYDRLLAEAAA